MEIYILDVGTTKYGDCILITQGGKRILIDAAHPGDEELLTRQLRRILVQEPPFNLDLFVITHCHGDHIGCAPSLISDGTIVPRRALVADEKLGYGRTDDGIGPTDGVLNRTQRIMIMALQEEDHSDLPDAELEQFLLDSDLQERRYIEMLETMEANGCDVIRYGSHTPAEIRSLETAFSAFGLKILGPSQEHLITCAQAIAGIADVVEDAGFNAISDDLRGAPLTELYRGLMDKLKSDDGLLEDAGSQAGAAKNNQSIVVKVAANGWSALLAGDMQYAKAGVSGMNDLMRTALDEAVEAGPYDFIKLTHHTASNGLNSAVFDAFSPCALYAHTGGKNDALHPNKSALAVLKENAGDIKFSRTDRNGMITIKKEGTKVKMINTRGGFNNFSLNAGSDESGGLVPEAEKAPENVIIEEAENDGYIEITAKIPHQSTRVTITIDVEQKKKLN